MLLIRTRQNPGTGPDTIAITHIQRYKIAVGVEQNPYSGKYDPPEHKSQPGFGSETGSQPGVSETDAGPYQKLLNQYWLNITKATYGVSIVLANQE